MKVLLSTKLHCLTLAIVAWAVSSAKAAPAQGAAADKSGQSRVKLLIRQLGDDSFHTREKATAELIQLGPDVQDRVKAAALNSQDPEVVYRSLEISREIDHNQLAQQRSAFLDGNDEQLRSHLASWRSMVEMTGDSREARGLFLQIHIHADDLLTILEERPESISQEIRKLYMQSRESRQLGGLGLKQGKVLAMVFAAASQPSALDASAISHCTSLLYHQQESELGKNKVFRQLLGKWVTGESSPMQQYRLLRLAELFNLKESVITARNILGHAEKKTYMAYAIILLGRLGGTEDLPLLESLIDNDTEAGFYNRGKSKRFKCKLGDVALGMCVVLAGQNPKSFGFAFAPEGRPTTRSYIQYSFSTEKQRVEARKKWRQWRKEHPSGAASNVSK